MPSRHWSSARRSASASPPTAGRWDHHLRSTPDNLHWGGFPVGHEPALVVRSGEAVRIDMLSHQGATQDTHPVEYFAAFGAGPEAVLPDAVAFWETRAEREAEGRRYGGHVLTGPVYVEGAEPGDTLAIDIMDLETRTPYGFNNTAPTGGVMATSYPGWREGDVGLDIPAVAPPGRPAGVWPGVWTHMYRVGWQADQHVVHLSDGLTVPARLFPGIVAVAPPSGVFVGDTEDAPPPPTGVQGSTPPWTFGGNLDVRDLSSGSTLYLPVLQPGGQVFVGDPHSCQGDGEVSGTAVEHSLVGTFRITVVEDVATALPWAEDDTHWIMMGIHWDLDRAMRTAVERTVDFLATAHGLTVAEAYSFASVAVDYRNAEVVDRTQVVTGHVPKRPFAGRS